jgi:hypothetical protein
MARRRMEEEVVREGAEGEAAARKGMDLLLGNQTILLHHMNEVTKHWLERRRDDIDAARQSLDDIGHCENWGEVLRIQQEWMLGSMRRLSADLAELASGALSLSQRAASRFGETTEAAAREWQRAGSEAVSTLSAAGAKPRTEGMGEAE